MYKQDEHVRMHFILKSAAENWAFCYKPGSVNPYPANVYIMVSSQ